MWSSAKMFVPRVAPKYSGTVCGVVCGQAHPHGYLASSNKQQVIFGPCLTRVLLTAISCWITGPGILSWGKTVRSEQPIAARTRYPTIKDKHVNQIKRSCKVS